MKKLLLIALLFVIAFAHEEMGDLDTQMQYKQNDRSPLLAGLFALTPTMGHLYMGKWERGAKILLPSLLAQLSVWSIYRIRYNNNKDNWLEIQRDYLDQ